MIINKEFGNYKVKLVVEDFKDYELKIIEEATELMAYALGSREFMKFCLNFTYTVKKYRWKGLKKVYWYETFEGFWKNEGKSQLEIYNHIMSGSEVLSPEKDGEADVYLRIDRSNKPGVIGYTFPSSKWQYVYSKIFTKYSVEGVAGNLAHEYMHKLGYSHERERTARRKFSVPYAVGYFVRDFFK